MNVNVHYSEGSAPRTDNVELCNASMHVAAGDRLQHEASLLLAIHEIDDYHKDGAFLRICDGTVWQKVGEDGDTDSWTTDTSEIGLED